MTVYSAQRVITLILIGTILALTFTGCHDLNNIVDPGASDYQGYHTVQTPEDVGADNPADGATVYFQLFYASSVPGRDDLGPYHFTIASSSDLTSGIVYDNNSAEDNIVIPDFDLSVGTAYYWNVRVYDPVSTSWEGGTGTPPSFIPGSIDASSVSPNNGESIDTTIPLITWTTIEGATGYECQISDTSAGVDSATAKSIEEPSYQITSAEGFSFGDVIYWRVRPVKTDDVLGRVPGFWSDKVSFSTPVFSQDFEGTSSGSLPEGWYENSYDDGGWSVTTSMSKEGDRCLVSDNIYSNDDAAVYLDVDCPRTCTVSFYKKVSSEAGYDELKFYIDGTKKDDWSGLFSFWTRHSYELSSGSHTLKWVYSKDSSSSSGRDRAWIDKVVIK